MSQSFPSVQPDADMRSLMIQGLDRNKCGCVAQQDIGDEGGGIFSLIAMTPSIGS